MFAHKFRILVDASFSKVLSPIDLCLCFTSHSSNKYFDHQYYLFDLRWICRMRVQVMVYV